MGCFLFLCLLSFYINQPSMSLLTKIKNSKSRFILGLYLLNKMWIHYLFWVSGGHGTTIHFKMGFGNFFNDLIFNRKTNQWFDKSIKYQLQLYVCTSLSIYIVDKIKFFLLFLKNDISFFFFTGFNGWPRNWPIHPTGTSMN